MVQNFNGLSSVTKVLEGYFIENIKKCKIQTIETSISIFEWKDVNVSHSNARPP